MRCIRPIEICSTIFLSLLLRGLSPSVLNAQDQPDSLQNSQSEALKIFIDTPDSYLDFDYVRTEITFVNYVRDRSDADVHILITTQTTGGGGKEFTLAFIGLKKFEGNNNTLKHISRQTDTDDDIRRGLVKIIKLGLMSYAAHTPVVEGLEVSYKKPEEQQAAAQAVKDPWNFWTFRINLRGYFNGEKSYKSNDISNSFSASRTTEAWKIKFSLYGGYTENKYDYSDDLSYVDIRRSYEFSSLAVKSLGNHWSVGGKASAWHSTYSNHDFVYQLAPGIEFNIFPYSESTRKLIAFQYLIGIKHQDYHEETIYLKTTETRPYQSLTISYDIKQPWGSIETDLQGANYLNDFEKYHLQIFGSIDIRIFKGLSFNCFGYLTFLRDQLSLPRRGASLEEVLLRRRQLETSYNYFTSIGLSYTFGSIYNNIVNPRFGGSGS
ncbi:hypothetical protein L0Z72_10585 [candidate division KSB1 bacterium]|nr:hypothetical protein [candidate division KSB1 bacterium]